MKSIISNLNACPHKWDGEVFHPVHHVGKSRGEHHDCIKERAKVGYVTNYRGVYFSSKKYHLQMNLARGFISGCGKEHPLVLINMKSLQVRISA